MKPTEFIAKKKRYEILALCGYVMIGVGFVLFIPLGMSNPQFLFIVTLLFLSGAIIAGIASKQFKKLSLEYKRIYISKMVQEIYPGSTYRPEIGFEKEEVYHSRILRKADKYFSEDLLEATYKNINFQSADVKLQDVRSNGKTTTVVTVFLGRVYRFDFPKGFKTDMVVLQPGFGAKWGFGSYTEIKTESIEFNQEFNVLAKNELNAFEILTPPFMERLRKLDLKYHDKIVFSFIENKLYVAIKTGVDSLDLKMFRKMDSELTKEFELELEDMKSIIDILKFERNI
ncbi:MAG: DUF3137 domain-containing protein [Firmicutes bacterium]|nr:DUF3137 domain-containing protein [Bacillota bacterium]